MKDIAWYEARRDECRAQLRRPDLVALQQIMLMETIRECTSIIHYLKYFAPKPDALAPSTPESEHPVK